MRISEDKLEWIIKNMQQELERVNAALDEYPNKGGQLYFWATGKRDTLENILIKLGVEIKTHDD